MIEKFLRQNKMGPKRVSTLSRLFEKKLVDPLKEIFLATNLFE